MPTDGSLLISIDGCAGRYVNEVPARGSYEYVLRSSLSQAMRWGWIWDNPAERAHRITTVAKEIRPPTPIELRTLLAHVAERDQQFHTLLLIAAVTGARRAQVLGLCWRNIDLERRRVSFCNGWVEGPNGPVLAATKTKRSHVVDIDPASLATLASRLAGSVSGSRPSSWARFRNCQLRF